MSDELILYREGMDYGIGMDTASGDARNRGIIGEPSDIAAAGGAKVFYDLQQVSTDEDIQKAMSLSASASAGFGPMSASANMDFAQKSHVHEYSVFLLATVIVTLGFSQIVEPKIAPDAAAKLADGDFTRFQEMYGDQFVRGMQTGGRFIALVRVDTKDVTEQQSLSLKLKASYGPFSASGSFSAEFSQAISTKSLTITATTEGGVVPKQPTSLEEVQQIAAGFAATVPGHAVPYGVILDKYTILDIPKSPNFIDLAHQLDVLRFCANERNRVWTALNKLDFILTNPGQFEEFDRAPLVAYQADLGKDLNAIKDAASLALDRPKAAAMPVLTAVEPTMPKRKVGEADTQAVIGEGFTNADPVAKKLRDSLPAGKAREGFHVGMAVAATSTLWGPGQESIRDSLGGDGAVGFSLAVDYCHGRNAHAETNKKGLAVIEADINAAAARNALPVGVGWLGFDIATGIFGDPKLGAQGNTLMGPGAQKIRDSLASAGQAGFDAAVAYHLGKKYV
jgi:hypothetical protein